MYRVTKRVELGIKATAVCSEKLQQLLKDIDKVWNNLIGFMSLATLTVSTRDNSAVAFLEKTLRHKAYSMFLRLEDEGPYCSQLCYKRRRY